MNRLSASLAFVCIAVSVPTVESAAGSDAGLSHAGFHYDLPGSGWRVTDRTRTDTVETVYFARGLGGRSVQIQVSALTPMRPIISQGDVNDWARGALSSTTTHAVEGRGALCARAERRWFQSTAFNSASSVPTAEFDEFGLFCAVPDSNRIVHVRLFERAAPGRLSGDAAALAETLFASVKHQAD